LTWLVCRTKPYLDGKSLESWKYDEVFAAALASESFASLVDCLEPITTDIFNRNVFPDCFQPRVVAATRRCPERENVLISLWRDLVGKDKIPQASTGCGLSSVATSTCSLRLASVLIDELGANLEYRGKKTQPAPLQRAAQKDTEENARFIDFLLHRGANPRVSYEKKDGTTREVIIEGRVHHMRGYKVVQLSEEKGAVGISKWLRKSWSQLCEETNGSRETNGN
jgi:hypothetical protein